MICKPIDRFGVLGSTTSVTSYNGINVGPAPKGPFTFTGTDILVGLLAKDESWTVANYLGEVVCLWAKSKLTFLVLVTTQLALVRLV